MCCGTVLMYPLQVGHSASEDTISRYLRANETLKTRVGESPSTFRHDVCQRRLRPLSTARCVGSLSCGVRCKFKILIWMQSKNLCEAVTLGLRMQCVTQTLGLPPRSPVRIIVLVHGECCEDPTICISLFYETQSYRNKDKKWL